MGACQSQTKITQDPAVYRKLASTVEKEEDQQDVQLTERDLGKNVAPKVDPADVKKVGEPTNLQINDVQLGKVPSEQEDHIQKHVQIFEERSSDGEKEEDKEEDNDEGSDEDDKVSTGSEEVSSSASFPSQFSFQSQGKGRDGSRCGSNYSSGSSYGSEYSYRGEEDEEHESDGSENNWATESVGAVDTNIWPSPDDFPDPEEIKEGAEEEKKEEASPKPMTAKALIHLHGTIREGHGLNQEGRTAGMEGQAEFLRGLIPMVKMKSLASYVEEYEVPKLSPRNQIVIKSGLPDAENTEENMTDEEKEKYKKLQRKLKESQEEENNFFMCLICFKVLLDPQECTKCDTAFCNDCITQWKKTTSDRCPLNCSNPEYKKLNRFISKILAQKRFCCANEKCEYSKENCEKDTTTHAAQIGFSYQEAIDHQSKCLYKLRQCENKCGKKVWGYLKEEHNKTCINYTVKCETCKTDKRVNDQLGGPHDCIQSLRTLIRQNQNKIDNAKEELGIDYEKVNAVCSMGHQVKAKRIRGFADSRARICGVCGKRHLDRQQLFYSCDECEFDMCRLCALTTSLPPVLAQKQWVRPHQHELVPVRHWNHKSWICSGYKQGKRACFSGMNNNNNYAWQDIQFMMCKHKDCADNKFKLCINCCLKYKSDHKPKPKEKKEE